MDVRNDNPAINNEVRANYEKQLRKAERKLRSASFVCFGWSGFLILFNIMIALKYGNTQDILYKLTLCFFLIIVVYGVYKLHNWGRVGLILLILSETTRSLRFCYEYFTRQKNALLVPLSLITVLILFNILFKSIYQYQIQHEILQSNKNSLSDS